MRLTNETATRFIKFLTDNNVYDAFVTNLIASGCTLDSYFAELDQTDLNLLVLCGFNFAGSKEGPDFWYDINIKWLDEMGLNHEYVPYCTE